MSLPWWISPTAVPFPSQTQLISHPYQHHSHIRLRKLSSSPSTSTAPRAVLLDEIVQLTHNKVFQSLAFILLNQFLYTLFSSSQYFLEFPPICFLSRFQLPPVCPLQLGSSPSLSRLLFSMAESLTSELPLRLEVSLQPIPLLVDILCSPCFDYIYIYFYEFNHNHDCCCHANVSGRGCCCYNPWC